MLSCVEHGKKFNNLVSGPGLVQTLKQKYEITHFGCYLYFSPLQLEQFDSCYMYVCALKV